jgi:D-beta-D-heptose 7-phosphate kinase/D-beta-D-heptose 1-phosphate adenosyltransferase
LSHHKIHLEPESLVPILEARRQRGEDIVFANGCFELLHVGHVRYLNGAKALGGALIVAINSDESMARIKRKPIVPDHERYELIAALEMVDFIVPLVENTPESLLRLFRPEIHTKGTDYTIENIPERDVVLSYGGRIELVGDPKDHSTTEMIQALRDRR